VYFVVFGAGFGTIMVLLSVALAAARQSIVHTMRRVLPYVNRIAGGLLVLAGAYVTWYGWIEIRGNVDDPTVARVTDWSNSVSTWMQQNRDLLGVAFVAALLASASYVAYNRRAHVR
jgi:sulfite exporter TauE/SafE